MLPACPTGQLTVGLARVGGQGRGSSARTLAFTWEAGVVVSECVHLTLSSSGRQLALLSLEAVHSLLVTHLLTVCPT